MKKTIIAAMLSLVASMSMAQSVNIYGLIDMGVVKSNGGTADGSTSTNKAFQVKSNTASRLGFRGTEQISPDLSASFQIEHRFQPDTGASTEELFWQGRSYLQLESKKFGAVYAGREYAPAYWVALNSDPFAWNGVASIGSAAWAGYSVDDANSGVVRTPNVVGYKSPRLLGSVTFNLATSLGEGKVGRRDGFNVEFRKGAVYVALGHDRAVGGVKDENDLTNVALHYDFGFVKAMGYYAVSHTGANDATGRQASAGLLVPVGSNGKVKAMYYRQDLAGANNTKEKVGLGYEYSLSKRTSLYGDTGFAQADGKTNSTTSAVGLKHTF